MPHRGEEVPFHLLILHHHPPNSAPPTITRYVREMVSASTQGLMVGRLRRFECIKERQSMKLIRGATGLHLVLVRVDSEVRKHFMLIMIFYFIN